MAPGFRMQTLYKEGGDLVRTGSGQLPLLRVYPPQPWEQLRQGSEKALHLPQSTGGGGIHRGTEIALLVLAGPRAFKYSYPRPQRGFLRPHLPFVGLTHPGLGPGSRGNDNSSEATGSDPGLRIKVLFFWDRRASGGTSRKTSSPSSFSLLCRGRKLKASSLLSSIWFPRFLCRERVQNPLSEARRAPSQLGGPRSLGLGDGNRRQRPSLTSRGLAESVSSSVSQVQGSRGK